MGSQEKENIFTKYYAKFTKIRLHLGGSIPFWDWSYSARLQITTPEGSKTELCAVDLITLKKLLANFDGRTGQWKTMEEKT